MSGIHGVWIAVFATCAFAISRQSQVECARDRDMAFPRAFCYAWETRNVGYDPPNGTRPSYEMKFILLFNYAR